MIKPHCDLEKYHYQCKDPRYLAEGMADVIREELSMVMPYCELKEEPKEAIPQPEWTKRQWDKVQQLQAMVLHLQNKVAKLSKKDYVKPF